jgi:hypothetical protein
MFKLIQILRKIFFSSTKSTKCGGEKIKLIYLKTRIFSYLTNSQRIFLSFPYLHGKSIKNIFSLGAIEEN